MKKELLGYDDFVMKQKPLIDAEVEKAQVVKASYTEKRTRLTKCIIIHTSNKDFFRKHLRLFE